MEQLTGIPKKYPEGVKDVQQFPLAMLERVNPDDIEKQLDGDEVLRKLWEEVKELSMEYFIDVCRFVQENERVKQGGSPDDLKESSETRRYKHDAFIEQLNILARNMNERGKDGNWLSKFNDDRLLKGTWALQYTLKRILTALEEEQKFELDIFRRGNDSKCRARR
jgi:hypothetical protein